MDKRRVLKEFEWFEVQTKVRQIISEVLQPLQERIVLNTTAIDGIKVMATEQMAKIDYLRKMVSNDPKIFEHGIFSTIESKFQESAIQIREVEGKLSLMEQFMDNKVALIDRQVRESSETIRRINEFKEYVKGQISSQSDKLVRSSDNIFANFDQLNSQITKLTIEMDKCSNICSTSALKVKQTQEQLQKKHDLTSKELSVFEEQLKDIKLSLELSEGQMGHLHQQIKRVGQFEKYTRKLQQKINDMSIETKNLEYKIEVIHPMLTLAQINQYTRQILPPKLRNNICIHFYNTYRSMAQIVTEHQFDYQRVTPSKKENINIIKEVHQRATKTAFKLKKQYLAEHGIDLDTLTYDKRQELLEKTELKVQFGEMEDMFGGDSPKKKPMQADEIARQMGKEKEAWLAELKEKIDLQLADSKIYLTELDQIMRKQLQVMEKTVNKCLQSCKNLQLSSQLQQRYSKEVEENYKKELQGVNKDLKRLEGVIRLSHNILQAYHKIEEQDEFDRMEIALMGVRQNYRNQIKEQSDIIHRKDKQKSPNIELNKDCLSCSENPNYYHQFFKIACLNYNSSPVKFNNQIYERSDLLQKIQKDIQQISKGLMDPNEKNHNRSQDFSRPSKKIVRYESNQIFTVPDRDTRSANTKEIMRNLSVSQEVLKGKKGESPRIINSKDLAEEYMVKNRSKIYSRRKESGYRQLKARLEAGSKDKMQHMFRVSSFFNDLKRQNRQFMN